MAKTREMTPKERNDFIREMLKYIEDHYPFLVSLVIALVLGRREFELQQLERRVDLGRPEEVEKLKGELKKLKNCLRKPPGPFRYLWLWIFRKKNGLKIYLPDLKKAG